MAAALFAAEVEHHSDQIDVSSAGIRATAAPAPDQVGAALAPYGIEFQPQECRALTEPLIVTADLVIGMTRLHIKEIVALDPPSWSRAFTYKELVRRGGEVGPRRPDQGFRSWIDAVHGDRQRASLFDRSGSDDLADPYGGSLDDYRATAMELAGLTRRLAKLLWPDEPTFL